MPDATFLRRIMGQRVRGKRVHPRYPHSGDSYLKATSQVAPVITNMPINGAR